MMASFKSFLSRRHTDRTMLTFVSSVFLLKQRLPPRIISRQRFSNESRPEQAEKLCATYVSGTVELRKISSRFLCFETPSLPTLRRRDPCSFAFYVTHPIPAT